jgi:hypothetical protein
MSITDRIMIALFYQWEGSALFGLAAFLVLLAFFRGGRKTTDALAWRVGLIGSILAVIARTLVEVFFFFGVEPWFVAWWQFALTPASVALVILVTAIFLASRASKPLVPITPVVRRHWLSFTAGYDKVLLAALLVVTTAVSVAAGLASSPDSEGRYALILTRGGGYGSFFGWAYSVPLLLAVIALIAALAWALHLNAARPYLRPGTVADENEARRALAGVLSKLTAAAILIPLGGALRFIGSMGMGGSSVDVPDYGRVMLTTGYDAFAPAIQGVGGLLEIWAVVLLLLCFSGRRLIRRAGR